MPDRAVPTPGARILSTAVGDVECRTVGQGPAVLVVHGSPGGIDQAEIMSRFIPRTDFTAVLLSRPGYLGTPLGDRGSWDSQGELLAALLDALEIDKAGILAWSGGGPAAYRLAARYPERVTGLIGIAAVSTQLISPRQPFLIRVAMNSRLSEYGVRVAGAVLPRSVVSVGLDSVGGLDRDQRKLATDMVMADPVRRHFVVDVARTSTGGGRRRDGWRNDHDRLAEIQSLELPAIVAPTLLVHGTGDTEVPLAHSELAAKQIPGAELITLEYGTHMAFYTHPESVRVQSMALELLRGNA